MFLLAFLTLAFAQTGHIPMTATKEAVLEARYKKFSSKLPEDVEKKFDKLLQAREKFEQAETEFYAETINFAYYESNQFPKRLDELEGSGAPQFGKNEFTASDKSLTTQSKRIPALWIRGDNEQKAEVALQIKNVQKTYAAYRNAWAAFGVAFTPDSTPEAWKAWITKERLSHIKEYDLKGPGASTPGDE